MFLENKIALPRTRAEAIATGIVADITQFAKEFGMQVSVDLSRAAWNQCFSDLDKKMAPFLNLDKSNIFRLTFYHMLKALHKKISSPKSCDKQAFDFTFFNPRSYFAEKTSEKVTFKAQFHAGDNQERVLTIKCLKEW